MSSEQTEKASVQRRKKAHEKGDRLMSREVLAATAMLSGVLTLQMVCRKLVITWGSVYEKSLALAASSTSNGTSYAFIAEGSRRILLTAALPLLLVASTVSCCTVFAGVVQGGGSLHTELLLPKWGRLNPVNQLKNLFGLQALVRLVKSMLPVSLVVAIAYQKIRSVPMRPGMTLGPLFSAFSDTYDLLLATGLIMLGWSVIDYVSAWRSRENRLKMTKQEVREEAKETEGRPEVKRRLRSIQRQLRQRKLRADVGKASVVVMNPTHYAVALAFDFETMEPPRVLAKGRNLHAMRIREEATWAGIPIVENPPLARALYKTVEPGRTIPFELYAAVAGILAYLYRSEMQKQMTMRQTYEEAVRRRGQNDPATAARTAGLSLPVGTPAIGTNE